MTHQNDSSEPSSPTSSIDMTPTENYSPLSAKRARETSFGSDIEITIQQQRTTAVTMDETDDEQLENAVAGWDCNDNDISTCLEISDLPPTEQIDYLETLKNSTMKEGDTWYLVANSWMSRWKQYCKRMASPMVNTQLLGSQTAPGPVDNSSVLNSNKNQLLPDLVEGEDYTCVPELAWLSLEKWYGISVDPIPRYVITEGEVNKETMIEIYPPTFKIYLATSSQNNNSSLEKCPTISLSRKTLVMDMKNTFLNAFDLAQDVDFELWRLDDDLPTTLSSTSNSPFVSTSVLRDAERINLDEDYKTISDLSLASGILVINLSQDNTDSILNSTTAGPLSIGYNNNLYGNRNNDDSDFGSSWIGKSAPVSRQQGICGLSNLGNTCFMNSALQCLSNTMQLTKWFLAGNYKEDLNRDNPLGMNGEIAENYGSLIEKLWSGTTASIAPRDFKYTISRFNPTFTGYQQHDSQELLAFLLDGLHEDMNRILKKPYIEMPDFDNMTDEEIAKTSWDYHKARNDSIIVDLFQGQFKSRLICNVCHKVSVTFDPFMYLSLPLPIQKKRKTQLVYVPYDPSITPQRMTITLDKDASFKNLKDAVAKQVNVDDPSTLFVVEIFNNKIYKVFPEYELVASIGLSDIIYVYQLPGPVPSRSPHTRRQPRFSIRSRLGSSAIESGDTMDEDDEFDGEKWIVFPAYCASRLDTENQYNYGQFGGPVILAMQAKDAICPENVYRLITKHVERYTMVKLFEEVRRPSQASIIDDAITPMSPASPTLPENEEIEDDNRESMDIDTVDQQPKLIRTAAAVTAAGGRQLEPINNLFTMKVFSENNYSSDLDDLIPTSISSWRSGSLEDLNERFIKENAERIEYEKARRDYENNRNNKESMDDTMDNNNDNNMISPNQASIDDYDNDVVADVASEWNNDDTTMTPDAAITVTNNNSDDTSSETSSTSSMIFEKSNSQDKSVTIQSASPILSTPSSPPPPPHVPPRRPPPRTVIRQGEGIMLDWRLKKAQELFGIGKSLEPMNYGSNSCNVSDAGWKEIDDIADPDAESDEKERNRNVTLMDCLDEFTKEEQLSEEDLWYCPQCKEHQRATKKFDIWHLPEIMVVHLKRFSHTRTLRDKIDAFIDFPMEELDMTDRVLGVKNVDSIAKEDRFIYDLYAVDNHFGGMGGGHYTAYAQNWQDGEWYNFDDSHVSKVEQKDAKVKYRIIY
ncbi:uncharacterized protein BX664DRAFT_338921 [Halteromyces radiatus]|uniref:uncharacterized protein n=1 Tax=Halteromyces radiatus TaxID=101107 RepID=UPI00221FD49A|nr:uncharacterized protein BX664DRAFT_338921 [Halteromyces radiatus]KAI8082722.1 hypothetical protein BX664DRAFT_338921 [Halteromyces radiatus]